MHTASDPIAAAYLLKRLDAAGIDYDAAITHLIAHERSFKCPRLGRIIREVVALQRHRRTGHSQMRHVRTALRDFYHALPRAKRDYPGTITREDILAHLSAWAKAEVKTFNERLSYITTVFGLAVERGWLVASPITRDMRKPKARHQPPPPVMEPARALAMLRWLQAYEPQWVRYFVFALFAALRPDVREGEAMRLDEDMRHPGRHLHRPALDEDGFWIRGKTGRTRHVSWTLCGPLRAWLNAYPGAGLIPDGLSYSQAERQLQIIRERFGITHDEMRHTGASAMLHMPGASFAAVAWALDNSERMLRTRYMGVWSEARSHALYAIGPASGATLTVAVVA